MDTENADSARTSAAKINTHVGERIRGRREMLRLTLPALAAKSGLPIVDVVAIENGTRRASASDLFVLSRALGVPTNFFFDRYRATPPGSVKSWLREVDLWFVEQLSPHERVFLGLARRLTGDIESARDLVHDAYARVLSGDTWRGLTQPRAYLLRSIHNLGLNRIRDANVVPMQQLARIETINYADMSPDAFETLSARESAERLMRALDQLPPKCRQVMVMRRLEELPPREIARRLGVSLKAVEKHLTKGMVLLAEIMDGQRHLRTANRPAADSDVAAGEKPV